MEIVKGVIFQLGDLDRQISAELTYDYNDLGGFKGKDIEPILLKFRYDIDRLNALDKGMKIIFFHNEFRPCQQLYIIDYKQVDSMIEIKVVFCS